MKRISLILLSLLTFASFAYAGGNTTNVDEINVRVTDTVSPSVTYADSPSLDSFGRLRTGQPYGILDSKQLYNRNLGRTTEVTAGISTTIEYLPNESSSLMTLGTDDGAYAIRQSVRYPAYVPGKSQLILATGVLGTGTANVVRRIGYFDDDNGLFFQFSGSILSVCVRTFTSGAAVDSCKAQADWNLDKFDGSGKSKIDIDESKTQIFVIDFQWLGVGRVRFGFDIDGQVIYVHEVLNANNLTTVYMTSPTLPVRYEIRNIGVSAGGTLKDICHSVISEGGYALPGLEFAAASGTTSVAVTTRRPVFAIRLKSSFGGKDNRRTARLLRADFFHAGNAIVYYELFHIHSPSSITATWTEAHADSAVEYSTDISAITGDHEHRISYAYASSATGASGAPSSSPTEFINEHSYINQSYASDNSQVFVIYATSVSGTPAVHSGIIWIEFD